MSSLVYSFGMFINKDLHIEGRALKGKELIKALNRFSIS